MDAIYPLTVLHITTDIDGDPENRFYEISTDEDEEEEEEEKDEEADEDDEEDEDDTDEE